MHNVHTAGLHTSDRLLLEAVREVNLFDNAGIRTQNKIAQNPKKGPKTRSKVKVRIEGYIENGSFSPLRIDPKIDFEPYCNPQNS